MRQAVVFGVGQGELVEGLFPVRDDLAFDESAGRALRSLAGWPRSFSRCSGSFVLDVADREP